MTLNIPKVSLNSLIYKIYKVKKDRNKSQIEIYQNENGSTEFQLKFEIVTVRLSLNQIADLFDCDKLVISRCINKIFKEKELDRN